MSPSFQRGDPTPKLADLNTRRIQTFPADGLYFRGFTVPSGVAGRGLVRRNMTKMSRT
jgi:hypothetical protein